MARKAESLASEVLSAFEVTSSPSDASPSSPTAVRLPRAVSIDLPSTSGVGGSSPRLPRYIDEGYNVELAQSESNTGIVFYRASNLTSTWSAVKASWRAQRKDTSITKSIVGIRDVFIPGPAEGDIIDSYYSAAHDDKNPAGDAALHNLLFRETGLANKDKSLCTFWGVESSNDYLSRTRPRSRSSSTNQKEEDLLTTIDLQLARVNSPTFMTEIEPSLEPLPNQRSEYYLRTGNSSHETYKPKFKLGDKNDDNCLRLCFRKIIRLTNRRINTELRLHTGFITDFDEATARIQKSYSNNSDHVVSLILVIIQQLQIAHDQALKAGKNDSQQSCLAAGMILARLLVNEYMADGERRKIVLDRMQDILLPGGEEPGWAEGVRRTFHIVRNDPHNAVEFGQIFVDIYILCQVMFVFWARYDRISYEYDDVRQMVNGRWEYMKAMPTPGREDIPFLIPEEFNKPKPALIPLSPWCVGLVAGFIYTQHHDWRWALTSLVVLVLGIDYGRLWCKGHSRKWTLGPPLHFLKAFARLNGMAAMRQRLAGSPFNIYLRRSGQAHHSCMDDLLKDLTGEVNRRHGRPISFRGALQIRALTMEQIRRHSKQYITMRICKDASYSEYNHLKLSRRAVRSSWKESGDFIYATKTLHELVTYDEWVLSIPFY